MKASSTKRTEIVELEEIENNSYPPITMDDCLMEFSRTSVGNTAVSLSSLHTLWENIIGTDISQSVHVSHIRNNVLFLTVDNPAWITQLQYMSDDIISKINKSGRVEKIVSISTRVKG